MQCHYSAVNFFQNSHSRHSISHPWRWGSLWVQSLIYVLLWLKYCVLYHDIFYPVIMAPHCISSYYINSRITRYLPKILKFLNDLLQLLIPSCCFPNVQWQILLQMSLIPGLWSHVITRTCDMCTWLERLLPKLLINLDGDNSGLFSLDIDNFF